MELSHASQFLEIYLSYILMVGLEKKSKKKKKNIKKVKELSPTHLPTTSQPA